MPEQGDYGKFSGGSGPHPSAEGRFGGGGWIDDGGLSLSDKDGKGLWRPPVAGDPDGEYNLPGVGHQRGDYLMDLNADTSVP